jgi:hypothetical protein
LTDNSHLEQKLKDEPQAAMMQKQKDLDGICKEAVATNQQLEGCRDVVNYLNASLLGRCSSQVLYIRYKDVLSDALLYFCHAAPFGHLEPEIASELCTTTEVV